jgi:signal peptidase I
MLPLLRPGDRIFVEEGDQTRSDLHDGDIIALRREDAIVLKRIVAIPGETISGADRKVFRNGKQLDEPYLAPATGDDLSALITFAPRTVGTGELFVMGDNRDRSFDNMPPSYSPTSLVSIAGPTGTPRPSPSNTGS